MAAATKPIYNVKKSERQGDNFSDLIAPSCTSIALLGQLLLLSKKRDFRLVEREKQVKHIKHPESFRACLLQLTHESWDAFNTAERNMNRVLYNVEGMPAIFDSITEILVDGETDDVIDLLPVQLQAINVRATKCVTFTKKCEEAFEKVMHLIEEISELCETRDLSLKNEHEEMTTNKLILENHKRQVEEDRKEFEEEKARLDAAMKEAQKHYDDAIRDLPGYGTLAMTMINHIVSHALPFIPILDPIKTKQENAELAGKRVFQEQTRYDKLGDIQREKTKEMLDVVNRLAKLKVSTLSVSEMRDTLVQSLALFVQIREQWGHLTRYFQFLADMVSENMNNEVKDFARLADGLKGKNMSKLKQNSLQRISDQAKQSIAKTQHLAGFYVDISRKHLMPNLNYVFEIEAGSSQRSETDTQRALENVRATCKNTIEEITDLADSRQGLKMLTGK